jgi:two-component system phosphate regulon response regulator PhoB
MMAADKTVLIVEDETDLADLLRFNLEREGYKCSHASNGTHALEELRRRQPDLLILDRMLPGMSGDELIARIRQTEDTVALPVLMLTAKAEESDELVGFAIGADDYVTKPFSMKVLLARVDALLRRAAAPQSEANVFSMGPLTLDRSRRELRIDDETVTLTSTEFGILWELMAARGRVLSRDQLIDKVLGTCAVVTDRTIDVHIAALRRKLGSASSFIHTIRGVGYAMRPQPEADL